MNCCYRHDREPVKNEEVMRSNLHQPTKHFLLIFGLPPGCEPRNNQKYSTKFDPVKAADANKLRACGKPCINYAFSAAASTRATWSASLPAPSWI